MTWWQRFFYGFNTTKNEEEKRDPLKGEITSPIFVSELIEKGFHFNEERRWWQRVWTTHTPDCVYPNLKQVWEVEQFNVKNEKWTYKIVNPSYIGQGNAGDSGSAWVWIGDERGKQP